VLGKQKSKYKKAEVSQNQSCHNSGSAFLQAPLETQRSLETDNNTAKANKPTSTKRKRFKHQIRVWDSKTHVLIFINPVFGHTLQFPVSNW